MMVLKLMYKLKLKLTTTGKIMSIGDVAETAAQLGLYMVTVILGLMIHACVTLPLIFYGCTRQNPWKFFQGMS